VTVLGRVKLEVDLGFDVHVFAQINAIINSTVAVLLVAALVAVKSKKYHLHKGLMMTAMILSVLFLVSYICHHLFAGETKFGAEGIARTIYYLVLFTHIPLAGLILPFILFTIPLAGLILPFILFTAYRALIGEWPQHKKLARITWPIWFYVAVTGVVVYWMISPYYV